MQRFYLSDCQLINDTMKKNNFFILLIGITILIASCSKEKLQNVCSLELPLITDKSSKKEDDAALQEALIAVKERAQINSCNSPTDFSIIPIGSKACGGPIEFIPYNRAIDTSCFFQLVNFYGEQMQKYNTKHGVISDCSVIQMPKGIRCENGKPVLFY
jgi:hypothetical protein